ncbi:MAG: hypothetical protein FD180_3863 [Planctomycetota bacterium]|nr:MAG: hypothetical protein FD180_3863 [Planctomycetota bacterium]
MRKFAVGLVVALLCGIPGLTEEPKEEGNRCELKLTNGSVIKGTLKDLQSIELKTKHGKLKFALKDVRSVAWGSVKKEELDTVNATDGMFKGWIEELAPLEVDTGFGVLKIPTGAIKSLRISKPGKGIGTDFESDSLDDWTKHGPTTWAVVNGKLQGQPSGNYDSIQYNESLEGTYTIEVEVTGANNAGILWNAQDANNANALWLSPGNVRVFGGGTWYNQQIAAWGTNFAWNTMIKVRIEVDGTKAEIFINDSKVGSVTTGGSSGHIGFFCFNQAASFDNFSVTR